MIDYIVEVFIEPEKTTEWLLWMNSTHIPEVLSTGYFLHNSIFQSKDVDSVGAFQIRCRCSSLKMFRDYQRKYAKELQLKYTELFGKYTKATRRIEVINYVEV